MGVRDWVKKRASRFVENRLGDEFASKSQALVVRQNEFGYDPFGFSRDQLKYVMLAARFLYRDYFRATAIDIDKVPAGGRVLLVANHSGQLPYDGVVIGAAMFLEANPPRAVRSMIERFVPTVPFASYLLARWGQVTGTPDNCRRLLENEDAILVFPEGARGISKPFSKRYQLQEFGLGFLRLALETNTPIVPVGVIGAEEQAPAINVKSLAKLFGTPSFPIVPYPPFVPLIPLPVKYRVYFGDSMHFTGDPDDDDEILVEMANQVKTAIASLLERGLKERNGIFR